MKTIQYFALCIFSIFLINSVSAQSGVPNIEQVPNFTRIQPEKSKIFSRMPSRFTVYTAAMDKLFSLKENSKVVIPLEGSNFFEGTIMEKVQHNEMVTTINISSSNFDGAMLTLTRRSIPGQPVTYIGRMMSMKHADAFVMTIQGDEIVFSKQEQALTVAE